jgi:hypothetical protein
VLAERPCRVIIQSDPYDRDGARRPRAARAAAM